MNPLLIKSYTGKCKISFLYCNPQYRVFWLRELQKTIAEERQKRENLEAELAAKSSRLAQTNATSNQLEIAERKLVHDALLK